MNFFPLRSPAASPQRTRSRFAVAVAAVVMMAASVLAVTGSAEAAKGGNSANAKACQKGGYANLVRSDGSGFTSTSECTSYAAEGGTLLPKPTGDPRCDGTGYLDLYRQDGTAFANASDCNSYAAAGNQLVSIDFNIVRQTVGGVEYVSYLVECSGLDLTAPNTVVREHEGDDHATQNGCGTLGTPPCEEAIDGTITGFYLTGTTASGSPITSRIVPSGCPE